MQPNGAALSPEGDTLYITDTGCLHPSAPERGACTSANTPRTIHAFDIEQQRRVPSRSTPTMICVHHVWLPSESGQLDLHHPACGSTGLAAVSILLQKGPVSCESQCCVLQGCRDGGWLLGNRRLFAVADDGVPDGIKVDAAGNVWTGVGDGVACYSQGAAFFYLQSS